MLRRPAAYDDLAIPVRGAADADAAKGARSYHSGMKMPEVTTNSPARQQRRKNLLGLHGIPRVPGHEVTGQAGPRGTIFGGGVDRTIAPVARLGTT